MKKIFVSAIAAVALAGVTCPTYADTYPRTTTQHPTTDVKTTPLSNAHKTSFDNVPKRVKDIARKHVGSARIEDVDVGTLNGKTVYELAYKKSHHPDITYELRITEDGKILSEHTD